MSSPTLDTWHRFTKWPVGKRVFSFAAGMQVPYVASIRPRVEELRPGYARVSMRDRRRVRNHLHSIHAVALTNLAEMTGNLALMCAQEPGTRWIILRFSSEYLKKARGTVSAECIIEGFDPNTPGEYKGLVEVKDAAAEVVVRSSPVWKIDRAAPVRQG